jgi:hypothetical protein
MARQHDTTDVLRSGRGWRCATGGARGRLPTRVPPADPAGRSAGDGTGGGSAGDGSSIEDGTARPNYADAYTATWRTYVAARWPGGHLPAVAGLMAGELREPDALIVDLGPAAVRRLLLQVHLRPPGLRQLLRTLVDAGLLIVVRPGDAAHFGTYVLVLPGPVQSRAA